MSGEDNNHDDEQTPSTDRPNGSTTTQPTGQAPPAQQRRPIAQGPSLSDELKKPESMYWLKFNVGVFLAMGVGYAIAFFLFSAFAPDTGTSTGMVFASLAFIMGLFLAPLLATITGIRIGSRYQDHQNVVLANSFVGSAVGFLLMFFVLFVLVSSQAPSSGGFGDLFGPMIGFTIGVGLTGLLTTYVVRWVDGR